MSKLYPWPGNYKRGDPESPVAVITLSDKFDFDPEKVAIWGPMKTENLGIEKVAANVLSNPNIRFIVVCGKEIRGHRSGQTILALIENGLEENGRIKGSKGAVPYIENISHDAVERFRNQVDVIDLLDVTSKEKIDDAIERCLEKDLGSFGEPYMAVKIDKKEETAFEADFALHSSLKISPWGKISSMEEK
ncbi:MAG: tetrahydromethanopterin S-methyltransferase subunit A [Candidatus Thermoplasmatota archaeon]|nr:tetrahydromethanopterin S-methyltransferase subunit A [Candidatus Thermoplasmatota archaeon]